MANPARTRTRVRAVTVLAVALTVFLQLVIASANAVRDDATVQANLGKLTDDILAGIETYTTDENVTEIQLPDVQQDFLVSLWLFSMSGSINLTGGVVSDFQRVLRYGESEATFMPESESQQLVVQTGIQLPKLHVAYDFDAKVGVVKQKGKIAVTVSGTKATTMMVMPIATLKPFMVYFKTADLGSIHISISDGVLGWLVTPITNLVTTILKGVLKTTIESKIPEVVNEALAKLDIAGMLRPPADLL